MMHQIKNRLFIENTITNIEEFFYNINKINVQRAFYTSFALFIMQIIALIVTCLTKGSHILKKPDIYYFALYIVMLIAMLFFLLIFIRIDKDFAKYGEQIKYYGKFFSSFILLWCASITLLDQNSTGQIMVYSIAIIATGVTPIYRPIILLWEYVITHAIFLLLLYIFYDTHHFWGNAINTTMFIIISWAISGMRYKKQLDDFNMKKIIEKQNEELSRANKELERLSYTDGLTGIYNRFMFDKIIQKEWIACKINKERLSLILIDIDYFKHINDTLGHQAGDECIQKVAMLLSASIRKNTDFLARYGGDEFAVVAIGLDKENIVEYVDRLKAKVEQSRIPHVASTVSKYITISLGASSIIPTDSTNLNDFIKAADSALYEAKKQRNTGVIA